jgi:hypothetical protein
MHSADDKVNYHLEKQLGKKFQLRRQLSEKYQLRSQLGYGVWCSYGICNKDRINNLPLNQKRPFGTPTLPLRPTKSINAIYIELPFD